MKVSFPLIALAGIFGAWAYVGFPSPDTLMSLPNAKDVCKRFATEKRNEIFDADADAEIKPISMWMKNGKIVVEVGAIKTGLTSYHYRLCVVGGGQVEIVSVLEHSAWR